MYIHRIYTVTTPCLNAQLSQVGKTYWKGYVRSLTHGNSEDILQRVDEVIDTRQQRRHIAKSRWGHWHTATGRTRKSVFPTWDHWHIGMCCNMYMHAIDLHSIKFVTFFQWIHVGKTYWNMFKCVYTSDLRSNKFVTFPTVKKMKGNLATGTWVAEPFSGDFKCVLQCVAVRCSVMQCDAVCCGVLQCAAVCCSVLQCAAVCCSVCCCVLQCVLQCAAVWYNLLQCVAVCCNVLQV